MINRRTLLKHSVLATGAATLNLHGDAIADPAPPHANTVAGYNYRLPDFPPGSRLLFQGDSITDMNRGRNEADRNHYLGHSYVYLIASRLGVEMPQARLDCYNRGISGHAVGNLRARWAKDAIDMKPDLLSVLIGVNDVHRQKFDIDFSKWEADYRYLLDTSRQTNPSLRIVLLDPFVLACGRLADEQEFRKWRDPIDRLIQIVGRLAKAYDAVHIPTQDIFDAAAAAVSPEQWIWDGVHPLPQGHELIARHWLQHVSARWPAHQ